MDAKNTWPIDPNAPKVFMALGGSLSDIIVIGHNGFCNLYGRKVNHINNIVEMTVPEIIDKFGDELTEEKIRQLKERANRAAPTFKIEPLPAIELLNPIVLEDKTKSGKVSPREQRNRERFNRRKK